MGITPRDPAHFDPAMGDYKDLKPFRMWCQKVLPLVYDDSLSYYEVLCKLVDYLNKTMEDVGVLNDDVEALHTAYQQLQAYVNDYFSTLDVQEEINNKLDVMAEDGTLDALLLPYFNAYKDEINGIVATQNENINNFENTVNTTVGDQNSRLTTLESRMDGFSNLAEGSTTGDAELTDIRVGYNGIVYPTAGDSVRTQVETLTDGLTDLADDVAILNKTHVNGTVLTGKYIDSTGVLQNIEGSQNKVEQIAITDQKYVYITAGTGWAQCYYSFQNNNGDVLSKLNAPAGAATTIENFKVRIPNGTTKLYVSKFDVTYTGVDFFDSYTIKNQTELNTINTNLESLNELTNQLEADTTTIKTTHVNGTVQTGKYIDYRGIVQDIQGSQNKIESFTLNNELYAFITAGAGWSQCYFSFQDENGNVLDKLQSPGGTSDIINNYKVRVPVGATTLYVAKFDVSYTGVEFFDKYELINQKDVDNLLSFVKYYYEPTGSYTPDKYIGYNGVVATTQSATFMVNTVNVRPGDVFKIKATANYSNSFYSITDANNNVLTYEPSEGGGSTIHTYEATLEMPQSAAYLNVAALANTDYYTKIKKSSLADGKIWVDKKWCCVGDSLTEVNTRATKRYYDYVAEKTGIDIVNMGLSGSGYQKKSNTNGAFYQRIVNVPLDADVITIFGSLNDLSGSYTLGTKTDTGTATIGGCINTTLDNLFDHFPLANVGIIAPTPWSNSFPLDSGTPANYVQLLKDICVRRGIPFLDLFHDSSLRPWEDSYKELVYTHDEGNGVHPDETGHKIIAPRFEAFLDQLLMH